MPIADLDGPLGDFRERTKQAREITVLVESASRNPGALTTHRAGVDLSCVNIRTENTANSMALIFLASAFEEFVREQAAQCGNYLMDRYSSMPEGKRHAIRDAYWNAAQERFKFKRTVLLNKSPDPSLIAEIRSTLESIQGFVVNDDASKLTSATFGHHSNNCRLHVVCEIFKRFGINKLLEQIAENTALQSHFGVTTKHECTSKLSAKWTEFYDRRNETVHSLGGSSGYAVEVIFLYIDFMELTAEALKDVLAKTLATW